MNLIGNYSHSLSTDLCSGRPLGTHFTLKDYMLLFKCTQFLNYSIHTYRYYGNGDAVVPMTLSVLSAYSKCM